MKRLPDGTYQISNSVTGETRVVKPEELPKFGLSAPDAPAVQAPPVVAQPAVTAPTPQVMPNPEDQVRSGGGFLDKIGTGAMNLGKGILKGIAKPAQDLGEGLSSLASNKMQQDANANLAFLAKKAGDDAIAAGQAGDPEKAARLFKMSQETAAQASQGFDQQSQDLETNKKKYAKGLAGTAATALSVVPGAGAGAGAVGNIATGATLGAAQGYSGSSEGNELTSAIGGGVLGGGMALAGEGLGALSKKLRPQENAKNVLTKSGEEIEQGVRQIKLKPEVGGAQNEQRVNQVLDDLGIKGSPQQQYAQLQPKMTEIEGKIRPMLQQNAQSFAPAKVQSDILDVLDNQGLLIGNEAKATAIEALNDVMGDVINKGQKGILTSEDLFDVKQKLNTIGQRLSDKATKGATLTPKEEVLLASRDALDNVISTYHPEVKDLTMQQSALFDAAKPLSAARNNPPTLRAMGFSIPSAVTIKGQQLVGGTLQNAGKVVDSVSGVGQGVANVGSKVLSSPLAISAATSTLPGIPNSADQTQQPQPTLNQNTTQDNGQNQVKQGLPPIGQDAIGGSIASPAAQAKPLNPYGLNTQQLGKLYSMAIASGDGKAANQVKQMYDLEVENEKKQNPAKKSMSSAGLQVQGKASSGLQAADVMEQILKANPNMTTRAETPNIDLLKGQDRKLYESAVSSLTDAIGGLRTGATVSKEQLAFYKNMLPKPGDDFATIQKKLNTVRAELKGYLNTDINDGSTQQQLNGIGNDGVGQ